MFDKLPYLEPIEDFNDLIGLLTNAPKFQERLKLLEERQKLLNSSLERFSAIENIEALMGKARAELADAKRLKADADEYAKVISDKTDKAYAETTEKLQKEWATVEAQRQALATLAAKHAARDIELARREKDAGVAVANAMRLMEDAKQLEARADNKQKEFEEKAARLKAVLG